jgi:hypothetical protein
MAVKIPQYEERLTPNGFGMVPQARGVEISGAVGQGMQRLGQAGEQLAGTMIRIDQQQQEANEMSQVGLKLSEFKQHQEEQYQKLSTSYRPDNVTDADGTVHPAAEGDYTGFHGQVVKQFQADRDAFLKNIQNPRVRQYAENHLLQLQDAYSSSSLQWEGKQTIAKRDNELIATTENYGKDLMKNLSPEQFAFANAAVGGMIANNDMLTPDQKVDRLRKAKAALLNYALQGVNERTPQDLVDALHEAVGKDTTAAAPAAMPGPDTSTVKGLITPGNIDLANRPQVKNKDGSISTVSSFSVNIEGKEVLLTPITEDGKVLTEQQAIEKYKKDGKNLGIFDTPEDASAYAQQLHEYQDKFYNAKKPAESGAVQSAGIPISSDLPMGMRNRNPGNIKYARQADATKSDSKDQGDAQARYETDEMGFAAMYRLALRKFDGGKNTVDSLIAGNGGWTPGNHEAAASVARKMGIGPNDTVDLRDPATLEKFGRALVSQEQGPGAKHYPDQVYGAIAKDVLAGKPVTKATSYSATSSDGALPGVTVTASKSQANPFIRDLVSQLPPEQIIPTLNKAEAEVHRQMGVARSSLEPVLNNHLVMAANGDAPPQPLTEDQFVGAYGMVDGPRRYEGYREAMSLAPDVQAAKTLPVDKQAAFLEARRPQPSDPLYAIKADKYQKLAQAIDAQNKVRADDPVAWAGANKFADVQPLNFNDRAAFAAELTKRQGVASTMSTMFGTKPALLTKAEQATLSAGFNNMTTPQKLDYLKTMRGAVSGDAYRGLVQAIAPDSPVTAVAGGIMAETNNNTIAGGMIGSDKVYRPDVVAGLILEGEQLLNPNKAAKAQDGTGKMLPMPPDKDMRQAFADQMGNSFAGNATRADITFQAVRAYYAGKSARDGDVSGNFDSGRMKEAIEAVTGGATEINGKGSVLRPWGMSEPYFKDQAKKKFDQAIAANGYTKGMFDQWGAFGLEMMGDPAGNGRDLYLVKNGNSYLFGKDGRPMVLDLTQAPSMMSQIPTSNEADRQQGQPAAPLPPVTTKPEKTDKMTTTKPKAK